MSDRMTLSMDLETFSSVPLLKAGLFKYAQAPDFEILLWAWAVNDGPVQLIDLAQGEKPPRDLLDLLQDPSIDKRAYNAAFEYYCLKRAGYDTPLDQWRCTMAQGLYAGYTAGLDATAQALALDQDKQKMTAGRALIRKFCIPRTPTARDKRERILPHHEPEKWDLFREYCKQDVIAERAIAEKLARYQLPPTELKLWQLDVRMNEAGIALDRHLIAGALEIAETTTAEQMEEAKQITGLANPKSREQLKTWLEEELPDDLLDEGKLPDVTKKTIAGLVADVDDAKIGRLLQLKQEFSKTSVKKYDAMATTVCEDGRARGLLQYYGANRTGRWAGRLVQVQNLPKNKLAELDLARQLVRAGDRENLQWIFGNVPDTLSQLVRTAFVPSDGNHFIVSDYSAIEARVIAWLADEKWRLDVFATHGKIYEASASAMFNVPLEHIVKGRPEYGLRQKGKVAELALGYGGSSGALVAMGALDMGLTEDELPEIVERWRLANPGITGLWRRMQDAALAVMRTGRPSAVGPVTFRREADLKQGLDYLVVVLPSGRCLYYAEPKLVTNRFGGPGIEYMGMDQVKKRWTRQDTYGGKLVENVTQAIARDCLAHALLALDALGHHVVMHIHDEAVIDAPPDVTVEQINEIMGEPIPWAPGLLLKAEGFSTPYYKKD